MTGETIYIVDDDADVRKALERSLSKQGYSCESYPSADAFLSQATPSLPSCLILDVRMPGMNGLDLQRQLLKDGTPLPIIFITGHGDIPMSVRAIKDGAVEFLEKPYQVEELLEKITQAISLGKEQLLKDTQVREIQIRYKSLTARETQVMQLLVAGASDASNKTVAKELNISHRTVDDHRANIMHKMQARSITELVEMAKICGAYLTR